jgi:hypothetical protein
MSIPAQMDMIAQEYSTEKIKVFVEGDIVDFNYMRNNTPFVDFVNDPKVCDVHAIITKQSTGGNGSQFSIKYYALHFPDMPELELSCITLSYDTEQIIREKLVKTFHSGLLPYINEKSGVSHLKIIEDARSINSDSLTVKSEAIDPWRLWVFRIGASGGIRGEEQKRNYNYELSARAKKISDDWKISNEYDYEREEGRIERDDGTKISTLKIEQDVDSKLVLSINSHWSYGVFFQGIQSTYENIKMSIEAVPAIQYNIYDWLESDRRQFTFSYYVGPSYYKYYERTILEKNSEWLWKESIEINLNRVERWGEIDLSLEGGHFFPGFENYYYEAGIDFSIRVSKGLSISLGLQAESIHNQRYLPASTLSEEELLLNTRKLPTTFEYSGYVGISFQFGSMYNNVVNERL